MPRRNRVPYPAWEQMWQIFCPWVPGTENIPVEKPSPARLKTRRQKPKNLGVAGLLVLSGLFFVATSHHVHAIEPVAHDNYMTISLNKNTDTLRDNYPSIFRSSETRYTNMAPFTKWSSVLERFASQFDESLKYKSTQKWLSFLDKSRSLSPEDQIDAVNTYMNKVKFISDQDNYNTSDYWATPMQFLRRGGDCEDYAIAKYVSLRALGFTEDKLRIAIVFDTQLRMPHAVLVVYQGNEAMVLDNQSPDIKQASEIKQYFPIYSINQLAWWRH